MSLFLQSCSIVFPLLKCYIDISLLSSRFCSNKIYSGALWFCARVFLSLPFSHRNVDHRAWGYKAGLSQILTKIWEITEGLNVYLCSIPLFTAVQKCSSWLTGINRRWCSVFQSDALRPTAEEEGTGSEGPLDTWWHFVAVCHLIWHLLFVLCTSPRCPLVGPHILGVFVCFHPVVRKVEGFKMHNKCHNLFTVSVFIALTRI